jgi:hypothetical protein
MADPLASALVFLYMSYVCTVFAMLVGAGLVTVRLGD